MILVLIGMFFFGNYYIIDDEPEEQIENVAYQCVNTGTEIDSITNKKILKALSIDDAPIKEFPDLDDISIPSLWRHVTAEHAFSLKRDTERTLFLLHEIRSPLDKARYSDILPSLHCQSVTVQSFEGWVENAETSWNMCNDKELELK
ncbi:hypothetical protein PHYBLDRAFT_163662 [Phycomyces blakesleeanus NRRL 1555(-)]|uniref:Uncharacterized protein n=1 Tax=Phycomyces blakesleeanus (strain ATCC 8743b / DSM 1359 / FGSC 10004 / NBRC 33097 / NRRL 1555) TaxID=763407 RepID=A0A167PUH7_PHYB8|nr:hypothetical protein PHYBLDRAFT_163662 [Phycomyces blakesleeanus NRRL 1555(-)]OAD78559.1 hypothetical protein PHYBLDRAFT_163662 [Phycomyces blakesleeanus NRRL 1555(-)]|eukprot:XP_018296599.1 hypothetical protein PHYBLDRAFT_163662 [Phycomyces blakesleeanus NRRL 1555(-)]